MPRDEAAIAAEIDKLHGTGSKAQVGWLAAVQTDGNAEPRNNIFNALLALRNDAQLAGLLRYDDMLRAPILILPAPSKVLQHDEL
jgi:hypothetical protein